MAADQLGVAEEVVRRAVAVEVATPSDNAPGTGLGKAHPHTRKLLADILGYQVMNPSFHPPYPHLLTSFYSPFAPTISCIFIFIAP